MDLDIQVILQFTCVGPWAGITHLCYTVLTSLKKDEEGQNVQLSTAATLLYQFLSCWCLVTPFTSNRINLAVYCLSLNFFADQISYRSYIGSVHRMWSMAVSGFSYRIHQLNRNFQQLPKISEHNRRLLKTFKKDPKMFRS